jgi:predicted membrane channel-forming protein YqfA (hemolysin III family)
MTATSDRLSRWTPAIFACALVNFGLALLLAVSGLAWPAAPAMAPGSLAMVHLLAIGWLTLLMFGALFQFVPVITSCKLPSQVLPLLTLIGSKAVWR